MCYTKCVLYMPFAAQHVDDGRRQTASCAPPSVPIASAKVISSPKTLVNLLMSTTLAAMFFPLHPPAQTSFYLKNAKSCRGSSSLVAIGNAIRRPTRNGADIFSRGLVNPIFMIVKIAVSFPKWIAILCLPLFDFIYIESRLDCQQT